MRKAGYDALVAFSQDNVTYTAGFLVPSHASNRFRRTITILAGDTSRRRSWSMSRRTWRGSARASPTSAPTTSSPRTRPTCSPMRCSKRASGSGRIAIELDYMPAQDYIRLRERLPPRHSCRAASSISTPA